MVLICTPAISDLDALGLRLLPSHLIAPNKLVQKFISPIHPSTRKQLSIKMDAAAAPEPAVFTKGVSKVVRGPLIPADDAAQLVTEALAWASLHGLLIGDKSIKNSGELAGLGMVHAPFSLLPSPFPEILFKQAVELGPLFNDLVDRVASDAEFLQTTLSKTRKVDHFTDRLLDIHSTILEDGIEQTIQLGMHRSDYMIDMVSGDLLQVELNTISSSFAGLAPIVSQLHRYILTHVRGHYGLESSLVPENNAADGFTKALGLAWQEFGNESAAILFVVQPGEHNMYDQHWLAVKLHESYGVRVIRKTLGEINTQGVLDNQRLLYIGKQPISVVYYRAGYSPNDYPSEAEWDARLMIERSSSIKCPSISYHLAGAKKIQQELAKPGILERFVCDSEAVERLRRCFAGLWSLEGPDSLGIIKEAIERPSIFVLKPQREGGGNNIYGDDVREKLLDCLNNNDNDGLAAYILMQRIFPPLHASYPVRNGVWKPEETVSELGIYAAYLRNGKRQIMNGVVGYLLRTKVSNSNEGGVATGYAVLDSIYLSDKDTIK